MTAALAHLTPARQPSIYADVPDTARTRFAELDAKVSRTRSALSGSFSTTVKLDQAVRDLAEIEALARATRISIRSGR